MGQMILYKEFQITTPGQAQIGTGDLLLVVISCWSDMIGMCHHFEPTLSHILTKKKKTSKQLNKNVYNKTATSHKSTRC